MGNPTIYYTFAFFIFIFILKLSKWSGWSTTKFQHMEIGTCDVAPAIENYYGPLGVVYYRLMAAWAKERDLPPSLTLD